MSPALEAHLRLIAQIPPHRIHKHERTPPKWDHPDAPTVLRRRAAIAEMSEKHAINPDTGKRWRAHEIAEEIGISKQAVFNHRRVLRGGHYRWKRAR